MHISSKMLLRLILLLFIFSFILKITESAKIKKKREWKKVGENVPNALSSNGKPKGDKNPSKKSAAQPHEKHEKPQQMPLEMKRQEMPIGQGLNEKQDGGGGGHDPMRADMKDDGGNEGEMGREQIHAENEKNIGQPSVASEERQEEDFKERKPGAHPNGNDGGHNSADDHHSGEDGEGKNSADHRHPSRHKPSTVEPLEEKDEDLKGIRKKTRPKAHSKEDGRLHSVNGQNSSDDDKDKKSDDHRHLSHKLEGEEEELKGREERKPEKAHSNTAANHLEGDEKGKNGQQSGHKSNEEESQGNGENEQTIVPDSDGKIPEGKGGEEEEGTKSKGKNEGIEGGMKSEWQGMGSMENGADDPKSDGLKNDKSEILSREKTRIAQEEGKEGEGLKKRDQPTHLGQIEDQKSSEKAKKHFANNFEPNNGLNGNVPMPVELEEERLKEKEAKHGTNLGEKNDGENVKKKSASNSAESSESKGKVGMPEKLKNLQIVSKRHNLGKEGKKDGGKDGSHSEEEENEQNLRKSNSAQNLATKSKSQTSEEEEMPDSSAISSKLHHEHGKLGVPDGRERSNSAKSKEEIQEAGKAQIGTKSAEKSPEKDQHREMGKMEEAGGQQIPAENGKKMGDAKNKEISKIKSKNESGQSEGKEDGFTGSEGPKLSPKEPPDIPTSADHHDEGHKRGKDHRGGSSYNIRENPALEKIAKKSAEKMRPPKIGDKKAMAFSSRENGVKMNGGHIDVSPLKEPPHRNGIKPSGESAKMKTEKEAGKKVPHHEMDESKNNKEEGQNGINGNNGQKNSEKNGKSSAKMVGNDGKLAHSKKGNSSPSNSGAIEEKIVENGGEKATDESGGGKVADDDGRKACKIDDKGSEMVEGENCEKRNDGRRTDTSRGSATNANEKNATVRQKNVKALAKNAEEKHAKDVASANLARNVEKKQANNLAKMNHSKDMAKDITDLTQEKDGTDLVKNAEEKQAVNANEKDSAVQERHTKHLAKNAEEKHAKHAIDFTKENDAKDLASNAEKKQATDPTRNAKAEHSKHVAKEKHDSDLVRNAEEQVKEKHTENLTNETNAMDLVRNTNVPERHKKTGIIEPIGHEMKSAGSNEHKRGENGPMTKPGESKSVEDASDHPVDAEIEEKQARDPARNAKVEHSKHVAKEKHASDLRNADEKQAKEKVKKNHAENLAKEKDATDMARNTEEHAEAKVVEENHLRNLAKNAKDAKHVANADLARNTEEIDAIDMTTNIEEKPAKNAMELAGNSEEKHKKKLVKNSKAKHGKKSSRNAEKKSAKDMNINKEQEHAHDGMESARNAGEEHSNDLVKEKDANNFPRNAGEKNANNLPRNADEKNANDLAANARNAIHSTAVHHFHAGPVNGNAEGISTPILSQTRDGESTAGSRAGEVEEGKKKYDERESDGIDEKLRENERKNHSPKMEGKKDDSQIAVENAKMGKKMEEENGAKKEDGGQIPIDGIAEDGHATRHKIHSENAPEKERKAEKKRNDAKPNGEKSGKLDDGTTSRLAHFHGGKGENAQTKVANERRPSEEGHLKKPANNEGGTHSESLKKGQEGHGAGNVPERHPMANSLPFESANADEKSKLEKVPANYLKRMDSNGGGSQSKDLNGKKKNGNVLQMGDNSKLTAGKGHHPNLGKAAKMEKAGESVGNAKEDGNIGQRNQKMDGKNGQPGRREKSAEKEGKSERNVEKMIDAKERKKDGERRHNAALKGIEEKLAENLVEKRGGGENQNKEGEEEEERVKVPMPMMNDGNDKIVESTGKNLSREYEIGEITANMVQGHETGVNVPDGHLTKANMPEEHKKGITEPNGHKRGENMPEGPEKAKNVPIGHGTIAKLPEIHQKTENVPKGHETTANMPEGHKTGIIELNGFDKGKKVPKEHETTAKVSEIHQKTPNMPEGHEKGVIVPNEHQIGTNDSKIHQKMENVHGGHEMGVNVPGGHETGINVPDGHLTKAKVPEGHKAGIIEPNGHEMKLAEHKSKENLLEGHENGIGIKRDLNLVPFENKNRENGPMIKAGESKSVEEMLDPPVEINKNAVGINVVPSKVENGPSSPSTTNLALGESKSVEDASDHPADAEIEPENTGLGRKGAKKGFKLKKKVKIAGLENVKKGNKSLDTARDEKKEEEKDAKKKKEEDAKKPENSDKTGEKRKGGRKKGIKLKKKLKIPALDKLARTKKAKQKDGSKSTEEPGGVNKPEENCKKDDKKDGKACLDGQEGDGKCAGKDGANNAENAVKGSGLDPQKGNCAEEGGKKTPEGIRPPTSTLEALKPKLNGQTELKPNGAQKNHFTFGAGPTLPSDGVEKEPPSKLENGTEEGKKGNEGKIVVAPKPPLYPPPKPLNGIKSQLGGENGEKRPAFRRRQPTSKPGLKPVNVWRNVRKRKWHDAVEERDDDGTKFFTDGDDRMEWMKRNGGAAQKKPPTGMKFKRRREEPKVLPKLLPGLDELLESGQFNFKVGPKGVAPPRGGGERMPSNIGGGRRPTASRRPTRRPTRVPLSNVPSNLARIVPQKLPSRMMSKEKDGGRRPTRRPTGQAKMTQNRSPTRRPPKVPSNLPPRNPVGLPRRQGMAERDDDGTKHFTDGNDRMESIRIFGGGAKRNRDRLLMLKRDETVFRIGTKEIPSKWSERMPSNIGGERRQTTLRMPTRRSTWMPSSNVPSNLPPKVPSNMPLKITSNLPPKIPSHRLYSSRVPSYSNGPRMHSRRTSGRIHGNLSPSSTTPFKIPAPFLAPFPIRPEESYLPSRKTPNFPPKVPSNFLSDKSVPKKQDGPTKIHAGIKIPPANELGHQRMPSRQKLEKILTNLPALRKVRIQRKDTTPNGEIHEQTKKQPNEKRKRSRDESSEEKKAPFIPPSKNSKFEIGTNSPPKNSEKIVHNNTKGRPNPLKNGRNAKKQQPKMPANQPKSADAPGGHDQHPVVNEKEVDSGRKPLRKVRIRRKGITGKSGQQTKEPNEKRRRDESSEEKKEEEAFAPFIPPPENAHFQIGSNSPPKNNVPKNYEKIVHNNTKGRHPIKNRQKPKNEQAKMAPNKSKLAHGHAAVKEEEEKMAPAASHHPPTLPPIGTKRKGTPISNGPPNGKTMASPNGAQPKLEVDGTKPRRGKAKVSPQKMGIKGEMRPDGGRNDLKNHAAQNEPPKSAAISVPSPRNEAKNGKKPLSSVKALLAHFEELIKKQRPKKASEEREIVRMEEERRRREREEENAGGRNRNPEENGGNAENHEKLYANSGKADKPKENRKPMENEKKGHENADGKRHIGGGRGVENANNMGRTGEVPSMQNAAIAPMAQPTTGAIGENSRRKTPLQELGNGFNAVSNALKLPLNAQEKHGPTSSKSSEASASENRGKIRAANSQDMTKGNEQNGKDANEPEGKKSVKTMAAEYMQRIVELQKGTRSFLGKKNVRK